MGDIFEEFRKQERECAELKEERRILKAQVATQSALIDNMKLELSVTIEAHDDLQRMIQNLSKRAVEDETLIDILQRKSKAQSAQLDEYKQVVLQVVEINIQRDDKGGYWCHECKSWNHRMDFDNRCTTKML